MRNGRAWVGGALALGATLVWWGTVRLYSDRDTVPSGTPVAARSSGETDRAVASKRNPARAEFDAETEEAAELEPAPNPRTPPSGILATARADEAIWGAEAPREGAAPGIPPAVMMENLRQSLRQYSARFGGNPVGDNAEITSALRGANNARAVFVGDGGDDDGVQINGAGEMVDAWGTPFFFHQISRLEMEIRSAGPDRRMWTADDLVIRG